MISKLPSFPVLLATMMLSGFASPGGAQQPSAPTNDSKARVARAVNITSDSAPGWIPSETLEQQVILTTKDYFFALDSGQYQKAYQMMVPITRQSLPYPQFMERSRRFHDLAGPVLRRSTLKMTWTKDPARAPFPGVYAAVDVAGKFANVDRECGYVVLYQKPSGGDFQVMRIESNFIDNAKAENIERTKSRAALDELWATLSANCHNFASTSPE